MKIYRLGGYQSWLIHTSTSKIIIDPWLTNKLSIPGASWLLSRSQEENLNAIIDKILDSDILLISSNYADHLNKESLSLLPKNIKVFCSKSSYKSLKNIGFIDLNILNPGQNIVANQLSLKGIMSGFPYSYSSLSFLIEDLTNNKRIFIEPHVVSLKSINSITNLDAFIGTTESVKLLQIELSMSPSRVFNILEILKPKYFLPTGTNANANEGFLNNFLSIKGNYQDLQDLLDLSELSTKIVCTDADNEVLL